MSERSIPIKDILEACMDKHDCEYPIEFTYYVRRYFIAGLNLGFFKPADLVGLVERFCLNIKTVKNKQLEASEIYKIDEHTLCVNEQFSEEWKYCISIFQAIFEVLSGADKMPSDYKIFSLTLASMVGERVYEMDMYDNAVMVPESKKVELGEQMLEFRSGYTRNLISVVLLKELFIANDLNENEMMRKAHLTSLSTVFDDFSSRVKDALQVIESIVLLLKVGCEEEAAKAIFNYEIALAKHFQSDRRVNKVVFIAILTSEAAREKVKPMLFENQGS